MRKQTLLLIAFIAASCGGGGGGGQVNRPPTVTISADDTDGTAPLRITFNAVASDPDGDGLNFRWDIDGDGTSDEFTGGANTLTQVFATSANVTVVVDDGNGATAQDSIQVSPVPDPVEIVSRAGLSHYGTHGGRAALVAAPRDPATNIATETFFRALDGANSWPATGAPIPFSTENVQVDGILELENGLPAVAGFSVFSPDTHFAVNSAADGSGSWTINAFAPERVSAMAAAMINGLPAICYLDDVFTDPDQLHFTMGNADGSVWSAPVVVDDGGLRLTGMLEIEGRPAIAYVKVAEDPANPGTFQNSLIFARANDAQGTGWNPIQVATGQERMEDFALIGGRPALVTITEGSSGGGSSEIRFYLADDTAGSSWNAPVIAMQDAVSANTCSLVQLGGFPVVVFITPPGATGMELWTTLALDVQGQKWGRPVLLDELGNGVFFGNDSAAELPGGLGIAYSNELMQGDTFIVRHLLLPNS